MDARTREQGVLQGGNSEEMQESRNLAAAGPA